MSRGLGDVYKRQGNAYAVVFIDHFSNRAQAIATPTHTGGVVAQLLVDHWIKYFGCPLRILTDRGPEFESKLFEELCDLLEIDKSRTTPYRPQSDGQCERVNQTIENMIRSVANDKSNWDEYLTGCLMAYNSTPSRATGVSPHKMLFGEERRAPQDLIFATDKRYVEELQEGEESCYCEFIQILRQRLRYAHEKAFHVLEDYSRKMKRYYDTGLKHISFDPGDWVIRYWKPGKAEVLGVPRRGPYVVLRACSPRVYEIQEREFSQPITVNVDDIRISKAMKGKSNWILDSIEKRKAMEELKLIKKTKDASAETDRVLVKNRNIQALDKDIDKEASARRSTRDRRAPDRLGFQ